MPFTVGAYPVRVWRPNPLESLKGNGISGFITLRAGGAEQGTSLELPTIAIERWPGETPLKKALLVDKHYNLAAAQRTRRRIMAVHQAGSHRSGRSSHLGTTPFVAASIRIASPGPGLMLPCLILLRYCRETPTFLANPATVSFCLK